MGEVHRIMVEFKDGRFTPRVECVVNEHYSSGCLLSELMELESAEKFFKELKGFAKIGLMSVSLEDEGWKVVPFIK